MDLQTERRLEQFFHLLDLPVVRVEPRMEFIDPPFRLYVEWLSERLCLSVALPVVGPTSDDPLSRLLGACQPERSQGIPLRGYALGNGLVVSCCPPPHGEAQQWLNVYRLQQHLLQSSVGGTR